MASLFTATNISRTVSSIGASMRRYAREQEKQQAYQNALYQCNVIGAESDVYTTIHHSLEPLRSISEVEEELSSLVVNEYDRPTYNEPRPDIEHARLQVEKEARKLYRRLLFWSDKEKCKDYVSNHLSERFAELSKQWELQKEAFDKDQDQREKTFNDNAKAEYDTKRQILDDFLTPTDNRVLSKTDKMLKDMEIPLSITTSFEFDSENGRLSFDVEFPDDSFIPTQKATILKSGKLSVSNKTKKELNLDYVTAICGVAYRIAASAFNISARVNSVAIFGHIVRINDKTATLNDDYLYAVVFDRKTFSNIVGSGDFLPHMNFAFFPHKISLTSQYVFKPIDPQKLEDSVADTIESRVSNELSKTGFKITSNIPNAPSNPNRAFSPDDGSDFNYLGYHDWMDVEPGEITLEDSSAFPEWEHMYVYSRSDVNKAESAIQQAYLQIRSDFLTGKFFDLSGPGKTNYGFVLFFDLFAAYAAGKSDIQKLCKELDVLTIVCGKTEKYIKRTFENCFKEVYKPQVDKDYVATYFSF